MEQEYRPEEDIDPVVTTPAPITTAEELLAHARALIADDLLTPEQLAQVQKSPRDFLYGLAEPNYPSSVTNSAMMAMVGEVIEGIVLGYFQSLLAKASEGEAFTEARIAKALLKGQAVALETLTAALGESGTAMDHKIRIAELMKS